MIQQKSFRDTLPFPTASILAFFYLTFYFILKLLQPRIYGFAYVNMTIFQWAFVLSIFTLAILMLVKIPNVGITITLGLISLIEIYWGVLDIPYYFKYLFDGYFEFYELYGITNIFSIVIFLMLTVQSISTYSNTKMTFFNAVWFLPGLLQLTSFTIYLFHSFTGRIISELLITSIVELFYALFIMFVGKWLVDVARAKHPDLNRPNDTVYNHREPRVAFVQPPVPPFVPQPPVPPVPVAPVVPPVPQAPFVPQPQVQAQPRPVVNDPVQELTRYKEMLDNGLITEDEYNAKKKQILNL